MRCDDCIWLVCWPRHFCLSKLLLFAIDMFFFHITFLAIVPYAVSLTFYLLFLTFIITIFYFPERSYWCPHSLRCSPWSISILFSWGDSIPILLIFLNFLIFVFKKGEQAQRRAAADQSWFSHLMLEMDFTYFHHFSWEKIHKNDRSHAIVIWIITSPIS